MATNGIVQTVCGFCHSNCGLEVHVKDGVIERVSGSEAHPLNRGALCPKALASPQLVYSKDRLTHPLVKTPSGFRRASWEEALDRIAEKMLEIKEKDGPQCVTRYAGAPVAEETRDSFVQLLTNFGSPNWASPGHLCSVPRHMGLQLVHGSRTDPDYEDTRCIVVWGSNPTESMSPAELAVYGRLHGVIQAAKKRGARLIVIDPRRTELAELADDFLPILPGTDAALGLAMLHVIVEEERYDREFVRDWSVGFPALREHVRPLSPQWAAGITGIDADRIACLARTYASTKPAAIREGNGLDQHTNVVDTVRITGMLAALTGNLDVPGGNVFFPLPRAARCPVSGSVGNPLGGDRNPLYPKTTFPSIMDAVLTGEPYRPKALIVYHGNPLLINADQAKVRRALEKLELLVVYDLFLTATAELADVVLPDASDFERYGYQAYSSREGGIVALRQKVIEPLGEARPIYEVEYDLARRLGVGDPYPWRNNEEWVDAKLKPLGIGFEDLRRQPIRYVTGPLRYRKYLTEGFATPSRKVEFCAEHLRALGYDPLPQYRPPAEEPDAEYPLIATTRRPGSYVHTRFRNLPPLRRREPEPLVRIHPDDARARGIPDAAWTSVRSPRASIRLKAKVTDEVRPGVVIVDFGWGNPGDEGPNVNLLTPAEPRDPYCSATSNRRFACQVEAEGAPAEAATSGG
ncbi:MAG: molybdopterin-dependent oxidoreductase [Deltaproteobacteria bacterium]|nr:molybdopterin-dependent oxidoreductase [Deltaproteobacteria bacterium]